MTKRIASALLSLAILLFMSAAVNAANQPCSGRKGGVSHCQGKLFVCNDGSLSKSKRSCSAGGGQGAVLAPSAASGQKDCSCRAASYCTGPRGGKYCYSDSGKKSYLKK